MKQPDRPLVGIGLLIVKDDKILLGQRIASHGTGEYGGTGGHLELGESFEASAMREFLEEAGDTMSITTPQYLCTTNMRRYLPKHYIDIGMVARWVSGEPTVMEPHKLKSWDWYPIDALPNNLFACMNNYIEAYKTGKTYFSSHK